MPNGCSMESLACCSEGREQTDATGMPQQTDAKRVSNGCQTDVQRMSNGCQTGVQCQTDVKQALNTAAARMVDRELNREKIYGICGWSRFDRFGSQFVKNSFPRAPEGFKKLN